MITKFLDPRNDLAFKRIFGTPRNSDILIHFLNDILGLKDDPIQTVTFLKVNQDPAVAAERQSIVDVMCEDEKHNKFIIEMQLARDPGFVKRAQYYASKTYIDQRDNRVDYKDLKNVRFLAIYEENLFSKKTDYISYHEMRDIKTHENDLDSFKFIFLELSKFKNKKGNLKTLTQKWAYFFKHAVDTKEEDLAEIVGSDLIIERAYKELDRFGWSKKELMEYEAVDMKIAAVRDALEESFSKGIEKGREEGREEGDTIVRKTVLNMHKMGMDIDTISKATSLTCEAIKKIIKEAENLADE
ncbi:MAG TPA: Rpn family recombination-promoting nuclease/putative transposase [Alphaproteobacteria bacterium]|nr:Rpn family recombination-promoting nuclease/putative transposase [Alphaproteobacteria bacterium]HQS93481.1 Rpn family recombination-promoting nuclease/putative transposase [Alphaproteobacteria bacterium]